MAVETVAALKIPSVTSNKSVDQASGNGAGSGFAALLLDSAGHTGRRLDQAGSPASGTRRATTAGSATPARSGTRPSTPVKTASAKLAPATKAATSPTGIDQTSGVATATPPLPGDHPAAAPSSHAADASAADTGAAGTQQPSPPQPDSTAAAGQVLAALLGPVTPAAATPPLAGPDTATGAVTSPAAATLADAAGPLPVTPTDGSPSALSSADLSGAGTGTAAGAAGTQSASAGGPSAGTPDGTPAAADTKAATAPAGDTAATAGPPAGKVAEQASLLAQAAGSSPVTVKAANPSTAEHLPVQTGASLAPSGVVVASAAQPPANLPDSRSTDSGTSDSGNHQGTSPASASHANAAAAPVGQTGDSPQTPEDGSRPPAAQPPPAAAAPAGSVGKGGLRPGATHVAATDSAGSATVDASASPPVSDGIHLDTPPAAAAVGTSQNLAAPGDSTALGDASAAKPALQPPPVEQLRMQLGKGLNAGNDTISVQLHPADLGRVEVKLELQDGQVKAIITADRADTLTLLKNDAPSLQQGLQDAGLQTDSNALSFQLRGEQQQRQQSGQGHTPAQQSIDAVGAADAEVPMAAAPARQTLGGGNSGVDISV
jgi:flagellar hook-length control protein FliK